MTGPVYLDWAATAPLCLASAQAMMAYLNEDEGQIGANGNANSLHTVGRNAFTAMENARGTIARCIGCRPDELTFTSGATESNNLVIKGMVDAAKRKKAAQGIKDFVPHVVTTGIEHDSVLDTVRYLQSTGVDVDIVSVDANGRVDVDAVAQLVCDRTVVVSIMLANNEIGTIQPIKELAEVVHAAGAYFHTDAVQALAKTYVSCSELNVDALSISSHKICGPKGIGALYVKRGTPLTPLMHGGGQESGVRSGTQNVMAMEGFAAACRQFVPDKQTVDQAARRMRTLRDMLYSKLSERDGVSQTVDCAQGDETFLPNIVHVIVDGIESETMVLRLDKLGVCVSGGSACSSGSLEPSHVVTQLGLGKDKGVCALRISLGPTTTSDDIDAFLEAFDEMMAWKR